MRIRKITTVGLSYVLLSVIAAKGATYHVWSGCGGRQHSLHTQRRHIRS